MRFQKNIKNDKNKITVKIKNKFYTSKLLFDSRIENKENLKNELFSISSE